MNVSKRDISRFLITDFSPDLSVELHLGRVLSKIVRAVINGIRMRWFNDFVCEHGCDFCVGFLYEACLVVDLNRRNLDFVLDSESIAGMVENHTYLKLTFKVSRPNC
jgi:hypothetical protein